MLRSPALYLIYQITISMIPQPFDGTLLVEYSLSLPQTFSPEMDDILIMDLGPQLPRWSAMDAADVRCSPQGEPWGSTYGGFFSQKNGGHTTEIWLDMDDLDMGVPIYIWSWFLDIYRWYGWFLGYLKLIFVYWKNPTQKMDDEWIWGYPLWRNGKHLKNRSWMG